MNVTDSQNSTSLHEVIARYVSSGEKIVCLRNVGIASCRFKAEKRNGDCRDGTDVYKYANTEVLGKKGREVTAK